MGQDDDPKRDPGEKCAYPIIGLKKLLNHDTFLSPFFPWMTPAALRAIWNHPRNYTDLRVNWEGNSILFLLYWDEYEDASSLRN